MRLAFGVIAAICAAAAFQSPCPAEEPAVDEKQLKAGDRDLEFLERVNESIRKGVEYVKNEQFADGSWEYVHEFDKVDWKAGATALALLTLLKSGTGRFDECIEKGFAWLKAQPLRRVYEVGITLMAIEARWKEEKLEDRIRGLTAAADSGKMKIPPQDIDWMKACVTFLLTNMEVNERDNKTGQPIGPKEAWGYPRTGKDAKESFADHSNTQIALLGLKSASRCGIRFPKTVFKDVLGHFLRMQEQAGPKVQRYQMIEDPKHGYVSFKTRSNVLDEARGWGYSAYYPPSWKSARGANTAETTGSMTAAGVASIILCLSELGPGQCDSASRSKAEKAVNDALAWLDHHFTVENNPGQGDEGWLYYYLYALERAAVMAGTRNIGKHDWYREGAEFLMDKQSNRGRWEYKLYAGHLPETCFALLFLTKATVPVEVKISGR